MKLKDIIILENAAGGSTGSGGVSAFAGRLFGGGAPIKRQVPGDKIPLIQYSKRKAEEDDK